MDKQYYKQLFISVTGIYTVYLSFGLVQEMMLLSLSNVIYSYRYVSPDGSRFKYTSVLLFIQCLINLVIAVIGSSIELLSFIGEKALSGGRKKFSLQIAKKDLVGRAVIYRMKDKELVYI